MEIEKGQWVINSDTPEDEFIERKDLIMPPFKYLGGDFKANLLFNDKTRTLIIDVKNK